MCIRDRNNSDGTAMDLKTSGRVWWLQIQHEYITVFIEFISRFLIITIENIVSTIIGILHMFNLSGLRNAVFCVIFFLNLNLHPWLLFFVYLMQALDSFLKVIFITIQMPSRQNTISVSYTHLSSLQPPLPRPIYRSSANWFIVYSVLY